MKKYFVVIFLVLGLVLQLSAESKIKLISTIGDVSLFRNNEPYKIKTEMDLLESDVLLTQKDSQGLIYYEERDAALLLDSNRSFLVSSHSGELRIITKKNLKLIAKGKLNLEKGFREGILLEPSPIRNKKVNVIIALDVSGSMEDFFSEVLRYLTDIVFSNIIAEGDYVQLFTFGEYIQTRIDKKMDNGNEGSEINKTILQIKSDEDFTNIGKAMTHLDSIVEKELPWEKTVLLFITDGKHTAPKDSIWHEKNIYEEGLFKSYSILKNNSDYKVLLLSIGENTSARDLSRPLGGEYIELSRDLSAEDIDSLLGNFINSIEIIAPYEVKNVRKKGKMIDIGYFSSYKKNETFSIKDLFFIDSSGEKIPLPITDSSLSIDAADFTINSYFFTPPDHWNRGWQEVQLEAEIEGFGNIQSIQITKIKFSSFPWWILLIILVLIIITVIYLKYFRY